MGRNIRIGIAEDHEIVRQGLVSLLECEDNLKVVFDVGNGSELLESIKRKRIDLLILDLRMPVISGKELIQLLAEKYPLIRIIVLSAYDERSEIIECFQLGAKAFIPKQFAIEKLIDAIYSVHKDGYYLDEHMSRSLLSEVRILKQQYFETTYKAPLNKMELSVIKFICQGLTNKEIADHLYRSKRTIDGIRQKIYIKTETNNTAELMRYAIQNRIVELD
jgi:two-component system, NarL family, response regulator NreC